MDVNDVRDCIVDGFSFSFVSFISEIVENISEHGDFFQKIPRG